MPYYQTVFEGLNKSFASDRLRTLEQTFRDPAVAAKLLSEKLEDLATDPSPGFAVQNECPLNAAGVKTAIGILTGATREAIKSLLYYDFHMRPNRGDSALPITWAWLESGGNSIEVMERASTELSTGGITVILRTPTPRPPSL
jgi:hypothetical protein